MHEMRVMSAKGDETVAEWDPANETEVEAARGKFNDLIAKGYKAYTAVLTKGRELTEFDPKVGKILFAPAQKPVMAGGPVAGAETPLA